MRVQLLMAQSTERELGMAWLWPERLDIEVPTAVCSAATMGALGRIPVETRIAPKSENWQLSPHRRGVGELCASRRRVFWSCCGRPRHAPTTRLGFPHGEGASPCGNPAGARWACRLRPGELQNTRCATTAEVKILHWGPSHVEMPTPTGTHLSAVPVDEVHRVPCDAGPPREPSRDVSPDFRKSLHFHRE